ncbi:MAG: zinc ribbon domain-containing protein [Acidobacteriaceae bacterium]
MGNGGGTFLLSLVVGAVAGAWVYSDAKKRGMNAAGWGIGAFLFCLVFLPLYLIMRKPLLTGPVGMPVPPGYIPPPGTYVQPPPPPETYTQPMPPPPQAAAPAPPAGTAHFCTQCGQRYEGTMKFCPNCGAAQG